MSSKHKYLVILPARLGAQRLPKKPLRLLGSLPIIGHTYNGVKSLFEHVHVATDAEDIATACLALDIPCIMTSSEHKNGTTRTLEAYQSLGKDFDYIINVQGDEAFISEEVLRPLLDLLEEKSPEAATLRAPLPEYHSNSNVFVVTDSAQNALYFSRSPIPAGRDAKPTRYQHVGVYAFTPKALKEYCSLSTTPLEQMEMLEQLRWLEHGKSWAVATAPSKPLSIDTPADLERAESFLKKLNQG